MLDLKKFAGFSPEDLIEELVRLGDDWADKRAAARVLKGSPNKREIADAMKSADRAQVCYRAFEKFIELKRTESVNRRVG